MDIENFDDVIKNIPKSSEIFVDKSMEILDRIHFLFEKSGWTQKELADKLGKKEEWVSRSLYGLQNFTLRTISELEAIFGEEIISVYKSNTQ